jgi:hypothetical protein
MRNQNLNAFDGQRLIQLEMYGIIYYKVSRSITKRSLYDGSATA